MNDKKYDLEERIYQFSKWKIIIEWKNRGVIV